MKKKTKPYKAGLSLTLDEAMRRDLFFMNNPVLMQGLALTPAVAATTTLKNAVVLSAAAFLLITPVRVLGDVLFDYIPSRLRIMVYSIFAALLYIPVSMVLTKIFGSDVYGPGMFIPLLIVDGIMLSRCEIPSKEGTAFALRNGLLSSAGMAAVFIIIGILREITGEGKIWGIQIMQNPMLKISATVAGGFIALALASAAVQGIANAYKHYRMSFGGEDEDE